MTYHLPFLYIFLIVVETISAQHNPHKNIAISSSNSPNEPTIAIHPKNPNIMLAGSNIDNLYRSKDTGATWQAGTLRSSYGVWGDPVIIPDTMGNFYFFHLSNPPRGNWIDRIVCQKSSNNGQSWTNGTYFGLNGRKAQDKHWAIVDQRSNYMYVTWTQFDKYGSDLPIDKSSIMFSMSKDEGNSWTDAIKINEVDGDCVDSDQTTEGAVPAIGPEGQLYVAWAGPEGLVFDRSMDAGKTWLDKDINIDPMPGGWDYKIPGIYRCNGLPVTVCDLSSSPHRGTVYVNWTDQRNGTDNTDVWLSKSTDEGTTWSTPIRVNNDDSKRHQFLTWMAVDPSNGFLYFVFYDRRNTKDNQTDVFMARSTDGGQTFVNFKINDASFSPNSQIFFGDYNNIVAQNDIVRPIWTRLDGSKLTIKTALIDVAAIDMLSDTSNKTPDNNVVLDSAGAVSTEQLYVAFKLNKKQKISLFVHNQQGKRIKKLFRCKTFEYGKHILRYDVKKMELSPGNYEYRLKQKGKTLKKRVFTVS